MAADLLDRTQCEERLRAIFEGVTDSVLYGRQAAAAVFVCLYVGAVGGERKVRPSTVLWMSDEAASWDDPADREAWYRAALRSKAVLRKLLADRGSAHIPWYEDTSREPLRDETFRRWAVYGAISRDETVATTSSVAQWSLDPSFAALFDPALEGDQLQEAIVAWQRDHLGTVALTRIALERERARRAGHVDVQLPTGRVRQLSPGDSSLILKGVIEEWAPRYLDGPAVLFVSESREHVDVLDARLLGGLGITVKADRLLPDALIFDQQDGTYWFVEAVATDGPITETRKREFIEWAGAQGIPEDNCRFLTAFLGRADPAFRRRVPDLAWGTFAWFLDEPAHAMELIEGP